MTKIKFGTDGWRAIIADDFTASNVARVAEATAQWLLQREKNPVIVLGHDCRFGGDLFSDTCARIFTSRGIKVLQSKGFVSTPMISFATVHYRAHLGIIITASHNPPAYNGYKIKGHYGGPLGPAEVQEIENMIAPAPPEKWQNGDLNESARAGLLETVPMEDLYIKHVNKSFDLEAIRGSGMTFAYDAMYGAGQRVVTKLFPDIVALHCDHNPGFNGQAPEPIHKNLKELSQLISRSGKISCGLATDGDADRLGLYDDRGQFVDSHHLILLLIHYLVRYKKMSGKVVVAFSTSVRIRNLCRHYNIPLEVVQIGFKHICGIMVKEDVLVGGEESGGIAIKGHIPERDGVWIGLTIWEFMARTGKSLRELIDEVYAITGPFSFERNDLHISEAIKQKVLDACRKREYSAFGSYKVQRIEDLDGYKFFFDDNTWMMIRASGTEPVLRVYAEAADKETADDILASAGKVLLS